MGATPRMQRPEQILFVTNRCIEGQHRFGKRSKIAPIFMGLLGKYQRRYGVKIFAAVCMSNHFHLILQVPKCNLHLFMRDFQRDLANEANRIEGRSGPVFSRPYSAIPILDDGMLHKMIAYLYNNPVKARLCRDASSWDGATTYNMLVEGKESTEVRVLNRTKLYELKRRRDFTPDMMELAYEKYELTLSSPSSYARLTVEARSRRICRYVETMARVHQPEASFDLDKDTSPSDRPHRLKKRTPAPKCLTFLPSLRKRFLEARKRKIEDYKESSYQLRQGKFTPFPIGTIPPGWLVTYTKEDYVKCCGENAFEWAASDEKEVPQN